MGGKKITASQAAVGICVIIAVATASYAIRPFMAGEVDAASASASAKDPMQVIYEKVAIDAIAHYRVAKQNGTPADACASLLPVTSSFLQAKDQVKYKMWKQIQKNECAAAGLPNL
ncbi:MAG TPA: hypothetical protein VK832_13650, partial [Burkholderiaceae bacterium]|nr:hypothetical protein [Burkholderiaceae bacterium]